MDPARFAACLYVLRCSILRTLCQQRTLPTRPGDQGFSQVSSCSAPDVPPEIRKEPEASLEFIGNGESNLWGQQGLGVKEITLFFDRTSLFRTPPGFGLRTEFSVLVLAASKLTALGVLFLDIQKFKVLLYFLQKTLETEGGLYRHTRVIVELCHGAPCLASQFLHISLAGTPRFAPDIRLEAEKFGAVVSIEASFHFWSLLCIATFGKNWMALFDNASGGKLEIAGIDSTQVPRGGGGGGSGGGSGGLNNALPAPAGWASHWISHIFAWFLHDWSIQFINLVNWKSIKLMASYGFIPLLLACRPTGADQWGCRGA